MIVNQELNTAQNLVLDRRINKIMAMFCTQRSVIWVCGASLVCAEIQLEFRFAYVLLKDTPRASVRNVMILQQASASCALSLSLLNSLSRCCCNVSVACRKHSIELVLGQRNRIWGIWSYLLDHLFGYFASQNSGLHFSHLLRYFLIIPVSW